MKSSYFPPDLIVNKTTNVSYELLDFLNDGKFGKVFSVQNSKTGEILALKTVCVNYIHPNNRFILGREIEFTKQSLDELNECPFIIQYTDVFKFVDKQKEPPLTVVCFVMELCEYSLAEIQTFSPLEIKLIADQLVRALDWLHSRDIVHRDVKPENIMFSQGTLKLIDFGFCKKIGHVGLTSTEIGTKRYMDPRIQNGKGYGKECDVYSLGVLLLELLEKVEPGERDDLWNKLQEIASRFKNVDQQAGLEDYMEMHCLE